MPLAAMLLSDLVIGYHSTIWYVYAAIAITVLIGSTVKQVTVIRVGVIAVIASLVFFFVTNFSSWLHHDMYSQELSGLMQAFIAGLPFLRNALIANLLFIYLVFYGLTWLKAVYSSSKSI